MYNTLVIDGDNIAHKNFYANAKLSYQGLLTGAIFGFIQSLLTLHRKHPYSNLFVTWSDNNSLRREIYPEYKAHRADIDKTEYFRQIDILKELLSAIGVYQLKLPNREADDCIAYVCEDINNTLIISEDKDLLQLIAEYTHLYKREEIWTPQVFQEEFEFDIHLYPLYLALMGDKSDNIKGAEGIGPVKAKKLIKAFGNDLLDIAITSDQTLLQLLKKVDKELLKFNLKLIDLKQTERLNPEDNLMLKNPNKEKVIHLLAQCGIVSNMKEVLALYEYQNK